jgi:hypothetical protein
VREPPPILVLPLKRCVSHDLQSWVRV